MSWSFSYHGKSSTLAEFISSKEYQSFSEPAEQKAYDSAKQAVLDCLAANDDSRIMYVQAMGHASGGYCQTKVIVDSQPHALMAIWTGAHVE